MKNFVKVFLTVLVMLIGTRCFALKANSNYPELVCDHGNMHYTIVAGDTLSEIAQHYRKPQAAIANASGITDPDRIYATQTMIIPCSVQHATTRSATVTRTEAIAAPSMQNIAVDEVSMELSQTTIPEQPLADLPLANHTFAVASTNETVAVVTTPNEQVPLTPSRSRSDSIKTKKVKGYQLVFTSMEAKTHGIVLNRDLPTRILLFRNEEEKSKGLMGMFDGEIYDLRSRAKSSGKNVALDISLTRMPNRPFIILIAGVNQPIDGDYFMASCEPIRGRFPGPSPFTRYMLAGGKMLLNTGIVTLVSGGNWPLGLAVGFGKPLLHAAVQHHVTGLQRKAEFELQQAEAVADMPVTVLVSNPTEIAVATTHLKE